MRSVPVTIAGREYALRYEYNDLCDLEDALGGTSAMDLFSGTVPFGLKVFRALIWVGVKWSKRDLTLKDAGALIGEHIRAGGCMEDLLPPITAAFNLSFPGAAEIREIAGEGDEGNAPAEGAASLSPSATG